LPKDYVIGVQDVLNVVFWSASSKDLSAEVLVRPDGKISLPILNDVTAVGMTPEQLAAAITNVATKFVRDPGATVIVRQINSRKVYVVGEVARPGPFPLGGEMNVLQAIAEAGGFLEVAKKGDVVIVRIENGKERRYKFNYNDVVRGKKIEQNIRLLPGDTIVVR
jgi:polysaccharide export outer membrane protein